MDLKNISFLEKILTNIIINIISVSENQVKIGIEAPSDIKILREEIYEGVRQHTLEASIKSKQTSKAELSKLQVNKINKGK